MPQAFCGVLKRHNPTHRYILLCICFRHTKGRQTYWIVLQLLVLPDLVPQVYQGYYLDTASNTHGIESSRGDMTKVPHQSIPFFCSIDELENCPPPLFKFEKYMITERDSSEFFPDAAVGRPNGRQFLSILYDGCFVSELIKPHRITDPAALDPFHADWPYWDRAT
jgi:hypothetical protein